MKKLTLLLMAALTVTAIIISCSNSTKPVDSPAITGNELIAISPGEGQPPINTDIVIDTTIAFDSVKVDTSCTINYSWIVDSASCHLDTSLNPPDTVCNTILKVDTSCVIRTIYYPIR